MVTISGAEAPELLPAGSVSVAVECVTAGAQRGGGDRPGVVASDRGGAGYDGAVDAA